MKPKISIITLGVKDLQKSVEFYKKLGFPLQKEDTSSIAFFTLEGTWLALFPLAELGKDAQVSVEGGNNHCFTMAHNVGSPEEVDATLKEAEAAGAKILKEGQKVFWGGYSGYFSDPDGFLWEVAHNPFDDLT